jgi:PIN domain nuclease of toxin-antitoxin system
VRLLLDTHLLLWAAAKSHRLPAQARELVEDPANDAYFSAASIWEIAIKRALRRTDFTVDLRDLLKGLPAMGFVELPVTSGHAARVATLPDLHRDPFDRLLVAQSLAEPLTLISNDAILARYSNDIRIV